MSGAPCWQERLTALTSAPHTMLEFPSTLPPQPTRPNARRPSAERDLIPRHLGSRKMRRFINDNFIESEIEMHEGDDEPYEWKGTTFSNPAVLMMISEEEFVSEAKPRIRQACPTPVDRIERAGHAALGCPKIARMPKTRDAQDSWEAAMGQVVSTGTVPPAGPGAVPRGRHADRWARERHVRPSRQVGACNAARLCRPPATRRGADSRRGRTPPLTRTRTLTLVPFLVRIVAATVAATQSPPPRRGGQEG